MASRFCMGKGKLRINVGVSLMTCDGGFRYRVNGSRASFLKAGLDQQEPQFKAGMEPDRSRLRHRAAGAMGLLVEGENAPAPGRSSPSRAAGSPFTSACAMRSNAIRPVPVSADEAYATIRVIEAALTSSAMGCRIDLQPAAPPVSR